MSQPKKSAPGTSVGVLTIMVFACLTILGVLAFVLIYLWWQNYYFLIEAEDYTAAWGSILAWATVGLALFTLLLGATAALTAFFGYKQVKDAVDQRKRLGSITSADLTLRLDERFHSDRALRIRHGATIFLRDQRLNTGQKPHSESHSTWTCDDNISPYSASPHREISLNSDLIDIFNYFDRIGYLVLPQEEHPEGLIVERMAWHKWDPWVVNYYHACKDEIERVQVRRTGIWKDLTAFYNRIMELRAAEGVPKSSQEQIEQEIDTFLEMEHARSHRGGQSLEPYSSLADFI